MIGLILGRGSKYFSSPPCVMCNHLKLKSEEYECDKRKHTFFDVLYIQRICASDLTLEY